MNRKITSIIFINLALLLFAVIFYVLPRLKSLFITLLSSPAGGQIGNYNLSYLDNYFLYVSIGLSIFTVVIAVITILAIKRLVDPVDKYIKQIQPFFPMQNKMGCNILSTLNAATSHAGIINCIPMGIMAVNNDGIIQIFNKEAGVIADLAPGKVIGSHIINVFSNMIYNKIMEVIITGKENLNLRNILKVGELFKEILFSISPLKADDKIVGALIIFQDVTPQQKMIELQTAYNVSKNLASQKDLESTVKIIASSAASIADIEYAAVFLADSDGQLIIMSYHGFPEEAVKKYNDSPIHIESPEIKNLYSKMVPLIHGSIINKPELQPFLIIPSIQSMYSFPVINSDKLIGMINLYSSEKDKLSKDTVYLIHSMSGQLNTAIANFYELQKNRALAILDGLTGLYNKTYFLDMLENLLSNAMSLGSPLTIAMLDIDNFKRINDTYGHQIGDEVIKRIAGIISTNARKEDKVCRYGGEEFSILMQNTSKSDAVAVVERIREAIEKTAFGHSEGILTTRITVSGGVANYPEDSHNLKELILYADIALYTAKKSGKNKVLGYTINQKML